MNFRKVTLLSQSRGVAPGQGLGRVAGSAPSASRRRGGGRPCPEVRDLTLLCRRAEGRARPGLGTCIHLDARTSRDRTAALGRARGIAGVSPEAGNGTLRRAGGRRRAPLCALAPACDELGMLGWWRPSGWTPNRLTKVDDSRKLGPGWASKPTGEKAPWPGWLQL